MPAPVGPQERGRGRRWRRSARAIAVVIVIVVALGFAVPLARGLLDESDTPIRADSWERLSRPPANDVLPGPDRGAAVWTGKELILLGSYTYRPPGSPRRPPNGLAYNPATRRWRVLPDPPLQPNEGVGGPPVWTGKELILAPAGRAYDPAANTWRRFTPAPTGWLPRVGGSEPVWTGAEVLVWGTADRDEASRKTIDGGRGAAYDPATDRWRRLPRSPLNYRTGAIVAWTGRLLLVISGSCGDEGRIRCRDGAAYDPAANTWTPIPAPAGGVIVPEVASAWTGSELIIWSAIENREGPPRGNVASAYDPRSGRWRTLPPAPIIPRRLAGVVWAGDRLLVWGGIRNLSDVRLAYPDDGAAYDPRSNRWRPLAKAPVPGRAWPLAVWTGDRAIFLGGMNPGDRLTMDRGNITAITEQGAAYYPVGLRGGGVGSAAGRPAADRHATDSP